MPLCCDHDLVYKAAGGRKLPAGRAIASAIRDVFSLQEQIDNPTTFRHWDKRMAAALEGPLLNLLVREAKRAAKESGVAYDSEAVAADLLALSRSRASTVASSVNSTTEQGLETEKETFSTKRAASIGITEANWASHAAQGVINKGKKWKWRTSSNKPCERCKKLNGKVVEVGKSFGETDQPPLHPNCYCTLEVVD